MKQGYKLINFAASVFVVGALASCTAESGYLSDPDNSVTEGNVVNLVKAPDVKAYSLSEQYSLENLNPSLSKWQWDSKVEGWPETTDRGEQVSTAEYNYVMEYLRQHPNEGYTEVDLSTYFLQNVGGSYSTYYVEFINGGQVNHSTNITGSNQMDYFEINGMHINDFNASYGPRVYVENLPLTNPRFHDSYGNLTVEGKYRYYYIPNEDGNGYSLYLCFDYSTSKYDNGQLDFPGDGVYNDWVIKIVPGDGSEVTPPSSETDPTDPTPDPTDPTDPVDPEDPDPTPGDDVDTPTVKDVPDHVETNLSIEKHADYLSTHLSIHVRANTNVEVFIPLKEEYYCQADDMEIVKKHEQDFFEHGGSRDQLNYKMTYDINGIEVSLSIAYEEDGIRITTGGINQDVLDYLKGVTGDGLTFEIWNYVNLETGLEDNELMAILKDALNRSTITFLDATPDLYVNAFNKDANGDKWAWDCTVDIIDLQKMGYNDPETDYFYNKSPYNELYYKK